MDLIFPLSSILLGFTWHYNHCFNDEKSGEKEKVKEKADGEIEARFYE